MSTIAIGDVHGNSAALGDLLDQLRGAVTTADTVVFLGDYIDRGPNSKECVTAILEFQRDMPATVVCLCGNHEDWLLRTRQDFRKNSWLLGMEAMETIQSYSPHAAQAVRELMAKAGLQVYLGTAAVPYDLFFDAMPPDHVRFLEGLLACYRTPDCLCVHGGVDSRVPLLQDQPREALIWGAGGFPETYDDAEVVVYGHRNNADLDSSGWPRPRIIGQTIGIDTISHGVLTAIRLPDRQIFQSARHSLKRSD
jgi:serine/threonine protein phosphatase 1